MSIKYPLRVEQAEGARFAHIRDASDRMITGTMVREDAEEIVNALNSQPKRQLPTIAEMSGLVHDFTNGKSMKEYMEELSDERMRLLVCV